MGYAFDAVCHCHDPSHCFMGHFWSLGSHSLPPEDFYFGAIVPFKASPQCYKTVLCLFLPVASITLRPYPVKMQAPSP